MVRKRLGVQINLVVVGVLGALLLGTLLVLIGGVRRLTIATGQQRVEQEVEVVQRQFDKAQREAVGAAKLLAAVPDLVDALADHDLARMRTGVLVNSARYGFSRASLVDATGRHLLNTGRMTAAELAAEDALLVRAGLEIDATAIVAAPEPPRLVLAVSVPMYKLSGERIGALVASRVIDTAFLDEINISRKSSDLLLIHDGQVIAQSAPNDARLAIANGNLAALLDTSALGQALTGQPMISSDLTLIAGTPYARAYVPLVVHGQVTNGVIGVLVDVSGLVTFQNQLITNLAAVFTLLALGAIGLTTLFNHRRVATPLRRLQAAAERMAQGEYGQHAMVTTQDEIGQLGQAFNTMAAAVLERETALERLTVSLEQRSGEVEQALAELRQSLSERDELNHAIREIASPVLPIMPGVLVVPLIGVIDSERAALLTQAVLAAIERDRAGIIILDVTGVPLVDTQVARALLQVAAAARLLGTQTVLVGLRPELAQTIVGLGLSLADLISRADLQSGISYALRRQVGVSGAAEPSWDTVSFRHTGAR